MALQVAYSYNTMDEIIPLYASAAIGLGGLKLAPSSLAIPLTASAPVMIIFSFWGFPPLERALGTLGTMRWSLLIAAPLNLLIPLTSVLAGNVPAVLASLAATFCCIRVFSTAVFTCSMVLVRPSPPPPPPLFMGRGGTWLASLASPLPILLVCTVHVISHAA